MTPQDKDEGMETTAEDVKRFAGWQADRERRFNLSAYELLAGRIARDFDRSQARVAELEAKLGQLRTNK